MPADPSRDHLPLPEGLLESAAGVVAGPAADHEREIELLVAANPAHATALRRLLADYSATERLLGGAFAQRRADEPSTLGPFRVLRKLGEGAFGEVYLCAQEQPIRRDIAVKVLRPGVGDWCTLRRFENERQLLASLQHPTVAQVLDAGTLDDTRPYFVMEHIDGQRITRYCDTRSLSVERRLALFLELCRGVQHAHSKGIVHRDLKPANVLVVEHGGRPLPKIIDFGIAKVLDGFGPRRDGHHTLTGRVVGTPGYMSPEQAEGLPDQVDARSDVFSLGVMLYELLTGELPWHEQTASTQLGPPRPSIRVGSRSTRSTAIAGKRSTEPRRLASQLRGDLDWIVLEAMNHARERRYQSVQEMIDDLECHLRSEPVRAGPPSKVDRLRKLARRHRTAFSVAGVVLLMALAGTAVSSFFRGQALAAESSRFEEGLAASQRLLERASDRRLLEAGESEEVRKQLLQDALSLHESALRARSEEPACRALRVRTLNALANVHYWLADYELGARTAEEAVREARRLVALDAAERGHRLDLADACQVLGKCQLELKRIDDARDSFAFGIAELDRLRAEDPRSCAHRLARAMTPYANALGKSGDQDGELAAQQRAIELLRHHLATGSADASAERDLVLFQCGLGRIHTRRGDLDAAEEALGEARRLADKLPGVTDEERSIVCSRLGQLYAARSWHEKAIAVLARSAELFDQELKRNPGRDLRRYLLMLDRGSLCEQHACLGDRDAAVREGRLAITAGEALAPGFPGRGCKLANLLQRVAQATAGDATAGSDAQLQEAIGWLGRVLELTTRLEPGYESNTVDVRFRALVDLGFLRERIGDPYSAARWVEVVAAGQASSDGSRRERAEQMLLAAQRREQAVRVPD